MEIRLYQTTIRIIKGDITNQDSDAIVNAANSSLMEGGGVDGAIHKKGGPKILEECKNIREKVWPAGLPIGKAVITTGGNLKAKYVIHTVGPIWCEGKQGEPELLAEAYKNSLSLASSKGLKSIAFPSISTGIFGYPIEKASRIALGVVKNMLKSLTSLEMIIFVLYSLDDLEIYKNTAQEILSLD